VLGSEPGGRLARVAARLARPATLALLAGVALWVWAALALWNSIELPALDLADLPPGRFFGDSFLERSASYERFLAVLGLLATLTLVAVLAVYARRGQRLMRESAAGRIGTGMLLGMLGFAVVWLAEVPFGLIAVWWQRRHDVSQQGYLEWLVESFVALGSTFLFVSLALLIAMGLAGPMRRWWWVAAAPVFVALAALFTFVSPYLVPDTTPLRDQKVLVDARELEREEGLTGTRIRIQDVDRYTDAPNAMATGIGPTRTVILWNTLLDGEFSRAEVKSVVAHELGHLSHDDPLRGIGWAALFLVPAAALIAWLTRGRGGMARPEAVPVALLVLVVLQLLVTPLFNVVSRRTEAAADWSALTATAEPAAARGAQRRLAIHSLSSPDPAAWSVLLYGSHPTTMQRIAMTYAWEEQEAVAPARPEP
jgi:STE24 endopeptidase